MKVSELLGFLLFTITIVLSYHFWASRWYAAAPRRTEGFDNLNTYVNKLAAANTQIPTPEEAAVAYKTVLMFISNDFNKGIKLVADFGEKFFGKDLPLRNDLDPRRILDNYSNPLER
jgi:hypothetical protein